MTQPIMPKTPTPADMVGHIFFRGRLREHVFVPDSYCSDEKKWEDWWYYAPHRLPAMMLSFPVYL